MFNNLYQLFLKSPLLILFLTIILGYFIGKFKIKNFVLGGIAGSLIMGVIIGQLNVKIPSIIGTLFFALFIYAVGYQGGPQFFRSLNRHTLVQLISAALTFIIGLLVVLFAAYFYHLDRGTAAGLAAGGLTQSAMIGTASAAIGKLAISAKKISIMQSNVAVGYAICYIFGSFGPILMLSAIFPAMMKWNLRDAAKRLAKNMQGDQRLLDPGQFQAIPKFDTRIYQLSNHSPMIGKILSQVFDADNHMTIEAIIRNDQFLETTPNTVLQTNDIIAVTAKTDDFIKYQTMLPTETRKPNQLKLTEEIKQVILSNKQLDRKTIHEYYDISPQNEHYGVLIDSVSRLGEQLEVTPDLILKRGDEIKLLGLPINVTRVSRKFGHIISAAKVTDFISFAAGIVLGILIGMITIRIHGIAISIGSGGGCLFSGLLFGWLRSRHPRIGTLPTGASNFLRDFGLAVFVATVGLAAGPQAIMTIKHHGMQLFLLGIGVTLLPQIISFYISYYCLKIKNPIILLSTIAGGRSANPGFAAILEKAGNSTPIVPFTATYAIANILLTLWGRLIVALVTKNVTL